MATDPLIDVLHRRAIGFDSIHGDVVIRLHRHHVNRTEGIQAYGLSPPWWFLLFLPIFLSANHAVTVCIRRTIIWLEIYSKEEFQLLLLF